MNITAAKINQRFEKSPTLDYEYPNSSAVELDKNATD